MTLTILSMVDVAMCPDVLAPLRKVGVLVELPACQDVLLQRIHEFDAFLTPLTVQTNREALQNARRLKIIATPSTGTDHIDLVEAQKCGIAVASLKDDAEFLCKITATAELAWALLLAVARRLPAAVTAANQGRWARDEFRGRQLSGKTLGIVGYGRLGRMVASFGQAFQMRVLVCDIKKQDVPAGVEQVDFELLLRESDAVSIHVHLEESTRWLFDTDQFRIMKRGALLINTSRGGVINETALLAALESGQLAGAGLDVIDGEWRKDLGEHLLIRYARQHENLIISPHIGGVTRESQSLAYAQIVDKLVNFLKGVSDRATQP